jgi:hypothetical protein
VSLAWASRRSSPVRQVPGKSVCGATDRIPTPSVWITSSSSARRI